MIVGAFFSPLTRSPLVPSLELRKRLLHPQHVQTPLSPCVKRSRACSQEGTGHLTQVSICLTKTSEDRLALLQGKASSTHRGGRATSFCPGCIDPVINGIWTLYVVTATVFDHIPPQAPAKSPLQRRKSPGIRRVSQPYIFWR